MIRRDGKYLLLLENTPTNVHSLEMAPLAMEEKLHEGEWVVLQVGVWSAPDIREIGTALSISQETAPTISFGIRPFDDFEEIERWCPEVSPTRGSAILLLFRDGELVAQKVGTAIAKETLQWVTNNMTTAHDSPL